MNVSMSSLTLAQSTSSVGKGQRPPKGAGGPPGGAKRSHADAIQTLGSELSEEVQAAMLESVEQLQEEGASFDDIKAFVDSELEANGVDVKRPGQLVNVRL